MNVYETTKENIQGDVQGNVQDLSEEEYLLKHFEESQPNPFFLAYSFFCVAVKRKRKSREKCVTAASLLSLLILSYA